MRNVPLPAHTARKTRPAARPSPRIAPTTPQDFAEEGDRRRLSATGITAYLAVAAILSLFTVGFVAMSRHIVNSGAFYSYISHGLGRVIGVGAAFVALPAYSVMQIGLYGLFGAAAANILAAFGVITPWWVCAIAAWLIVTVLGLLWVDLSGKVLAVLLVLEISIVLIYDLTMLSHPHGGHITFSSFSPAPLDS